MSFIVDRQTQDDLNLFSSNQRHSIFGLFNHTRTRGGAEVLKQIFSFPLSDASMINERASTIAYLQEHDLVFDFKGEWFDSAEFYLSQADERIFQVDRKEALHHKFKDYIGGNSAMDTVVQGIDGLRSIVTAVDRLVTAVDDGSGLLKQLRSFGDKPFYRYCLEVILAGKIGLDRINEYDEHLRRDARKDIEMMLHAVYEFDCYVSLAAVARERGFARAELLEQADNVIDIKGLYHPLVPNAIANDLHVSGQENVVFLTGANMAGKSTFMKAFSLAVYLAHAGIPVPASSMSLTLQQGMYTSINLADNLNMGFSHFYAEVRRIKKVAECISRTPRLVIVFDELFRGTNVRDAFEATLAISRAFATHAQCTFMISTHIIEAGEELAADKATVQFGYFPTVMEGNTPRYTYRLTEGITTDRQGMLIINNEHILDMLDEGRDKPVSKPADQFIVDKQTLDDLKMLGKFRKDSIYSLFNRTRTRGGEVQLDRWFNNPLTDAVAINTRSLLIGEFMKLGLTFPFGGKDIADIENFINEESYSGKMASTMAVLRKKCLYCLGSQSEYEHLREMTAATIRFLTTLDGFLPADGGPQPVADMHRILCDCSLRELMAVNPTALSTGVLAKCNYIMHGSCHKLLDTLLGKLYELDAYISVASVASERGFVLAKAMPADGVTNTIKIKQVYHPALKGAVANDVETDETHNFIFLTGANMAGKSTFMKSFSTAVYLAHMGFPVAAQSMTFTVQDGLYTSINVADNISQGFSYFYREVLRVKEVAEQVSAGKRLVILFDELFKGTNVKDAYNGTLAISRGFASYKTCTFMLSTHITEAADPLRESNPAMRFVYLPTDMDNGTPRYTYHTREGVTTDRHGMLIIRNEGILDLLAM